MKADVGQVLLASRWVGGGTIPTTDVRADRPHFHSGIFSRSLEIWRERIDRILTRIFSFGKRLADSVTYGCREKRGA